MKALPKAKKVKKVLKKHNDSRIDNYYWLRDDTRKNKAVLNYLKTERAYHDEWIKTQLNISNKYFNAGIMVINYEKWVNSKIKNSLVDTSKEIENNIVYWDQDVMNK